MAMKKDNAIPWWGWSAWLIAIALGIIAYSHIPAQVGTHFNLAGKADRVGSRFAAVLVEPAIMVGIMLLWHVLWRIDPKKRNYETFWPTYRYIGGIIVVFIGLMYLSTLSHLLNIAPVEMLLRFGPTIYAIMIVLLANVFPRVQQNWWIGIRTPWTLSSKASWNRTHRLAGNLGIPTGVIMIILVWILPNSLIPFAIVLPIILWVFITVVASYLFAKKHD